jgi:5-methylcytosine-specific restriction endonuclease McrA
MKKKNQIKHYPKHYCDKSCKAMDIDRVSNDFNYYLYGPDWQNSRSQAMKRDNQSCRICGTSDKRLEVHHIKKRVDSYDEEKGRFVEDINSMDNLVTLCADHHKKLEGKFSSCSTDEFVEKSKDLLQS